MNRSNLLLERRTQKPTRHLSWSLQKNIIALSHWEFFRKYFILDLWKSSKYAYVVPKKSVYLPEGNQIFLTLLEAESYIPYMFKTSYVFEKLLPLCSHKRNTKLVTRSGNTWMLTQILPLKFQHNFSPILTISIFIFLSVLFLQTFFPVLLLQNDSPTKILKPFCNASSNF